MSQPIFVGQASSGRGYHAYPGEGSLVTEQPTIERLVAVEFRQPGPHAPSGTGRWVEGNPVAWPYGLPAEAVDLVRQQLGRLADYALTAGRRIVRTNSSWDALQSRGTIATIYNRGESYVVIAIFWSRYVGDNDTTAEIGTYRTLDEARTAAEAACQTRPSFGDVEYAS